MGWLGVWEHAFLSNSTRGDLHRWFFFLSLFFQMVWLSNGGMCDHWWTFVCTLASIVLILLLPD